MEKQIELFKQYGVENYTIVDGKIIVDGSLNLRSLLHGDKDFLDNVKIEGNIYLESLTSCDKDFLQNTSIGRNIYLDSLVTCDKDFLRNMIIGEYLDLRSLIHGDKDFLKNTVIRHGLNLDSLQSYDKDFLKNTTMCGDLNLTSLSELDSDILNTNVKKLIQGYNKESSYCYFDTCLSKVLSMRTVGEYTIYVTPFEIISQKNKFIAHGKTLKKAISDVEFKIISYKLAHEPILPDTEITVQYYRMVTGACDNGCQSWMNQNELAYTIVDGNTVETNPIKAKDLLPILEKSDAYGIDKFRQLVTW